MAKSSINPVKLLLQGLSYAAFMAVVWYLSIAPVYHHIQPEQALIVVSFKHAGELLDECRQQTPEELAKLSPNMRKLTICSRERSDITLEVLMDDEMLFSKTEEPPGLYKDGSVSIYYSARVPVGEHKFELKMKDSVRREGYAFTFTKDLFLKPAQVQVISFNTEHGFVFK